MAFLFKKNIPLQSEFEPLMETQNIEFKESWRDECLKWICGFANAQGGTRGYFQCSGTFRLVS